MRSSLRVCSVLALLGAVTQVHALGLGEARVRSDLSSPLLVEIPVVGLAGSGVRADEIEVVLSDDAERLALGAPERILPPGVRVQLVAADGGGALVRMTTERASREPVLRFSLRASWGGGVAVRRYELIVDPPAVAMPRARLDAPRVVRAAPATRAAPAARSAPAARARLLAPPTGPRTPARAGSRYGPVRAGDTLYAIVAEAYPALAGDPARAAQAIVERNPQAFIGGDPGRVLLGATLELPQADAIAPAPRTPAARVDAPASTVVPGSHTVRPGDTLYGVVRTLTGAGGAALAAAVERVYAANPQAFIDGDRDRLRVGAVLSVDAVSAAAAEAAAPPPAVAPAAAPVSGAAPAAVPAADAAPAAARASGAAVTAGAPSAEPAAAAGSAEAVASVQAELASLEQVIAQERTREADLTARLDRVLAEAAELRERDRLLSVETEAMRERLADLAREPAAAASGEAAQPAAAQVATSRAPVAGGAQPTAAADVGAAPSSAPAAPPAVRTARAPAAPVQPERAGTMDRVLATVSDLVAASGLWLAAGLAAAAALLALLALRRRGSSPAPTPAMDAAAKAGEDAAKRRLAELRERHEGASTGDFTEDGEVVRTDSGRKVVMTTAAEANKLAKEAAVHMAYGNMEESKACILEAIRLDPGRDEHKMMLITVYESTNEHAKARAIVDDLLKRREELPQDVRAQVERRLESVKAG